MSELLVGLLKLKLAQLSSNVFRRIDSSGSHGLWIGLSPRFLSFARRYVLFLLLGAAKVKAVFEGLRVDESKHR